MAKGIARTVNSVVGGITGANDAMDAQMGAANNALNVQKYMYDQTRSDNKMYRDMARDAVSGLQGDEFKKDFTMSDFYRDPGYQFRMQEGQKALERSAAARGGLQSGATLRALAQYGQNFATNEYQNAYNRFNADRDRRFNRLSSMAGMGQTANSQVGAAGQNYANQAGNIYGQMGQAQAANAMGGFNTLTNLAGLGIGAKMAFSDASFSDAALKENIKKAEVDIDDLLTNLTPYEFNYKDQAHGKGTFYGVLAQDLEKSKAGKTLVVDKKEGKAIDVNKAFHALLAANSYLAKQVKELKEKVEGAKNV